MPQTRTPPPNARSAALRVAADLIGAEELARRLAVAPRTLYALASGKRPVRDGHLADTRRLLIEHRQRVGETIAAIRAVEDGRLT